jgi:hypothetical protein
MNRRGRLWSVVLAVGLVVMVSSLTPNYALARGNPPACKLPGLNFVWSFIDWLFPSADSSNDDQSGSNDDGGGNEDEGEKMFDEFYGPW